MGLSHRIHVQTLVFGRAKRKRGNVSEGGVLCFVGLKERENRVRVRKNKWVLLQQHDFRGRQRRKRLTGFAGFVLL